MSYTPEEALKLAAEQRCEFVDLKFMDLPGLWQHFTVPVDELTVESFVEGFGFDGSSIRGFKNIHESAHALAAGRCDGGHRSFL